MTALDRRQLGLFAPPPDPQIELFDAPPSPAPKPAARVEERYDLRLGEPPLYLVVDPPARAASRCGPPWAKAGELYQTLHVISPALGGEVRGYWLIGVEWHLRLPLYPIDWPAVDAEVARVLGRDGPPRRPCPLCGSSRPAPEGYHGRRCACGAPLGARR